MVVAVVGIELEVMDSVYGMGFGLVFSLVWWDGWSEWNGICLEGYWLVSFFL